MNDLTIHEHGDEGVGATHYLCNKHRADDFLSMCCACSGKTDCSEEITSKEQGK